MVILTEMPVLWKDSTTYFLTILAYVEKTWDCVISTRPKVERVNGILVRHFPISDSPQPCPWMKAIDLKSSSLTKKPFR